MSDEEWNRRAAIVRDKAVHANNRWEYVYACRYLNLLKDDAHFKFPDEGMFNREGFSRKTILFFRFGCRHGRMGRCIM